MGIKTFSAYTTEDLDDQVNEYFKHDFENSLYTVVDIKFSTSMAKDDDPEQDDYLCYSAMIIYK